MKKILLAGLLLAGLLSLAACGEKNATPKLLDREGVAPYELSEGERYLLQAFNMERTAQILSFCAPKEAITMDVNAYRLGTDGAWSSIGGGAISLGEDRAVSDQLIGSFTMQLRENYTVDFNISAKGLYSFTSEEISLAPVPMASGIAFLTDFQNIELNKEIPIALMVYNSGSSMRSMSLSDYFEPSKFADMDLVQAVTLRFSDKFMP